MSALPKLADVNKKFDILFNHGLLGWDNKFLTPSKRFAKMQDTLCEEDCYRPKHRFLATVKKDGKTLPVRGTPQGIVLTVS